MQMTMTFETCARCRCPIHSGEPAVRTASVDIIDGRIAASSPRAYHLHGGCYHDAKTAHRKETKYIPNAA